MSRKTDEPIENQVQEEGAVRDAKQARQDLEARFLEGVDKVDVTDLEKELDDRFKLQQKQLEARRELHYKERGPGKRSMQQRREREEAAAQAARRKQERKEAERQRRQAARAKSGAAAERLQERRARRAADAKARADAKREAAGRRRQEGTPFFTGRRRAAAREEVGRRSRQLKGWLSQFAETELEGSQEPQRRREGVFRRLGRFVKGLKKYRGRMAGRSYYTAEKRRAVYRAHFADCFSPLVDAWEDLWATGWNFLLTVAGDTWTLLLFIVDLLEKAAFHLWGFVLILWDRVWDIRYWIEANKIQFLRRFMALVFSMAAISIFIGSITAYEYVYYGKVLGMAKSRDEVYKTIDVLGDKLSEATGTNVALNVERDIKFRKVMGFKLNIDSDDDILNNLTYMKDLQVRAYGIFVEDDMVVVLENEQTANNLIKNIQNTYAGEKAGVVYESIQFGERVTVQEVGVRLGAIWNQKDAQHYLTTGKKVDRKHTVSQGETFGEIAKAAGLSTAELQASNPGVNPEKIYIGQELSLTQGSPLVSVHSREVATYNERIPYETQYIDNAAIYQGETEVKSRGVYGQQQIVAEVVRTNGLEISRTILSSDKVSDPVDEVLYRGTKPIPPKEGTGSFNYPIRTYTITSRFGTRWGRMHTGVDFGAPMGTKIYAADGGTVTFAGWKGSYGYLVIISHGSLFETYYAHCSKLLVGVGDKVYQGQNIALVGSTGNSTGSHLHFEVRYNDLPRNPLDYL